VYKISTPILLNNHVGSFGKFREITCWWMFPKVNLFPIFKCVIFFKMSFVFIISVELLHT